MLVFPIFTSLNSSIFYLFFFFCITTIVDKSISVLLFFIWTGVYTVCEDKIDRCSLYGPDICFKYTTWAAVQCPKFCVFCERKITIFLLISKYLLSNLLDILFKKSKYRQMIDTIILKIKNLT